MLEVGRIERPERDRERTRREAADAETIAEVGQLRAALASALRRAAAAERRALALEERLAGAWRAAVSRWP